MWIWNSYNARFWIYHWFFLKSFFYCEPRSYGENLKDQTVVEKNLWGLSLKFNIISNAIKKAKDINILYVNELIGSLLVYEQKLNKSLDKTLEHTL